MAPTKSKSAGQGLKASNQSSPSTPNKSHESNSRSKPKNRETASKPASLGTVKQGRVGKTPKKQPAQVASPSPSQTIYVDRRKDMPFRFPDGPYINESPALCRDQMTFAFFTCPQFRESLGEDTNTYEITTRSLICKISMNPNGYGPAAVFWAAWWAKFELHIRCIRLVEGDAAVPALDELIYLQRAAQYELHECVSKLGKPLSWRQQKSGPYKPSWDKLTERELREHDVNAMKLCSKHENYLKLLQRGRMVQRYVRELMTAARERREAKAAMKIRRRWGR